MEKWHIDLKQHLNHVHVFQSPSAHWGGSSSNRVGSPQLSRYQICSWWVLIEQYQYKLMQLAGELWNYSLLSIKISLADPGWDKSVHPQWKQNTQHSAMTNTEHSNYRKKDFSELLARDEMHVRVRVTNSPSENDPIVKWIWKLWNPFSINNSLCYRMLVSPLKTIKDMLLKYCLYPSNHHWVSMRSSFRAWDLVIQGVLLAVGCGLSLLLGDQAPDKLSNTSARCKVQPATIPSLAPHYSSK